VVFTGTAVLGNAEAVRQSDQQAERPSEASEVPGEARCLQKPTDVKGTSEDLKGVEEILDWLTRYAIAVRKAGTLSRDIRADEYVEKEEGPDMSSFKEEMVSLLYYIQISPYMGKESPRSVELPAKSQGIGWLQNRLIKCNIRRRSKLYYAARHDRKLSPPIPKPTPVQLIIEPLTKANEPAAQPILPEEKSALKNISKSIVASTHQSTVATRVDPAEYTPPSQQQPDPESVLSTPDIAGTAVTGKLKTIYPPPPKVDSSSNFFQCPFCRQLLPRGVAGKDRWRYAYVGWFYVL
jgi:hypothetical protein